MPSGSGSPRNRRKSGRLPAALLLALSTLTTMTTTGSARTDATEETSPADTGMASFLDGLALEAQRQGVSPATVQRVRPFLIRVPEVIDKIAVQPEHTRSTGEYIRMLVSDARIAAGRDRLVRNAPALSAIEARFKIDRHVLLAIWGIETNYGTTAGAFNILSALTTLAHADPRRAAFWRGELIAALRIVEAGDIAPEAMAGSWAGAMGHTQFMPTTYRRHAVDFDGDGRRDIWSSDADALASAASYLVASGWKPGAPAGFEVQLPAGFDFANADPAKSLPIEAWQVLGVTRPAGAPWPVTREPMSLLLPAGAGGPTLLVSANYRAILRYNASMAYALSVGLLADAIAGRPPLTAPWPAEDKGLAHDERRELQERLAALGHDTGGVDGVLGNRTRDAIRAFQRTEGVPADGHPSLHLLQALRDR